jgi:hypothetical protein
MPRTIKQQEAAAAAAEEWLDQLDPNEVPGKDATPLRELRQRFEDYAIAGRRLAEGAAVARGYGFSWGQIGMTLGISKQGAQARFGKPEDWGDLKTLDVITDNISPEIQEALKQVKPEDVASLGARMATGISSVVSEALTQVKPEARSKLEGELASAIATEVIETLKGLGRRGERRPASPGAGDETP